MKCRYRPHCAHQRLAADKPPLFSALRRERSAAARETGIGGLSAATTLMTHLVPQFFVFMLSHFLSSLLDYASQDITSLPMEL